MENIDFERISIFLKDKPIKPFIELDGGYACCANCWCEVTIENEKCPHCGQLQDWSWYGKYKDDANYEKDY